MSPLVAQGTCLPVQEACIWSLGQENPLEKETATHSSILAWEVLWTEQPGRLQSRGLKRAGQDLATKQEEDNRVVFSKIWKERTWTEDYLQPNFLKYESIIKLLLGIYSLGSY